MVALWNMFQCWTSGHEIPDRIVVLIKDMREPHVYRLVM